MKRVIVFVTYGSYGDINPMLAIAHQLASRCCVRFITNETYREHIEASGVAFFAAGTHEEQTACVETKELSGRSLAGLLTQFRQHVGKNIARIAAYLAQWKSDGEELLVVTHGTINPAFPICEQLGIPVVRAYYAPSHLPLNREDFVLEEVFHGCPAWKARWIRWPRYAAYILLNGPPHARDEYNEIRLASGIGPSLRPVQQFRERLLGRKPLALRVAAEMLLTPKWFAEPIGRDIEHVHCVGFPLLDPGHASVTIAERKIEEFIARYGAPVVFTPGTGVEDMDEFCRPMESACYKLEAPGILLARHGHAAYRKLQRVLNHPILHVEYADMAWLLPRAKLLVHTGGIGTVAQAIRAAVPQIIYPIFNDQPRNALRVVMNGLGAMLQGDGYSGSAIAELFQFLTTSELHSDCRQHYSRSVQHEDGARNAAELLEQLSAAQASVRAPRTHATPEPLPAGN